MVAQGMAETEIVEAYPDLEADDIREALVRGAIVIIEAARVRVHALPIGSRGSGDEGPTVQSNRGR